MDDTQQSIQSIYTEDSLIDGIITFPSFHRRNTMDDIGRESWITSQACFNTTRKIEHYSEVEILPVEKSRLNVSLIQIQNTVSCTGCRLL
jgi:hypothetical protein